MVLAIGLGLESIFTTYQNTPHYKNYWCCLYVLASLENYHYINQNKDGKNNKSRISQLFRMCYDTVCDWIKRYETTGDYKSKQGVDCGRQPKYDDKQSILNYIQDNPDASGIEIRNALAPTLGMSTFYATLDRGLVLHIKKEPKYTQQDEGKRSEFVDQIKYIDVNKLVFIDESGADDKLVVLKGWSPKGLRSHAEQKGFRSQRLSLIAGYVYGRKQIIAPFEFIVIIPILTCLTDGLKVSCVHA